LYFPEVSALRQLDQLPLMYSRPVPVGDGSQETLSLRWGRVQVWFV
jgi:hypothetical protein